MEECESTSTFSLPPFFIHQVRPEQHRPAHSGIPQEVCHPRLPAFHHSHRRAVRKRQEPL